MVINQLGCAMQGNTVVGTRGSKIQYFLLERHIYAHEKVNPVSLLYISYSFQTRFSCKS